MMVNMMIFPVFIFSVCVTASVSMSDEKRLLKHLLENYEKVGIHGRPVYNTSETIFVKFGLALIKLLEVNTEKQTVTFTVWQRYAWNDILLKWDPQDFGGVTLLRLPVYKIWTPDIVLYNSVGPEVVNRRAMAVVSNDGNVMWIPPATVTLSCSADGFFPHETQHCLAKYGSWTYDGFQVDVSFYDNLEDVDITDYIEDNNWDLVETAGKKNVKYYPCCAEPYPDLVFQMEFKRTPGFASLMVQLPTALLFLMTLILFWLQPGSVSKFVIGGFVFIGFLLMSKSVPTVNTGIKLFSWHGFGMILAFTSMLCAVITSAVAKKGQSGQALSSCLNNFCVRVLGMITCSDVPAQSSSSTDSKSESGIDKDKLKQQWVAFAQVLDRLAFLLHLLVVIIMAATLA